METGTDKNPENQPEDQPDPEKKKSTLSEKLKENERLNKGVDTLWDNRIEIFSSLLLLAGIILAYFYMQIGGTLVGLGFGICFYEEIHGYFLELRGFYTEKGLYKTLMWAGMILYFLISIPAFIIASVIGYGAMSLVRWSSRKQ